MHAARIIGGIGRALIAAGVLILLFVAYQLWGTGLQEARAQHDLKNEFEQSLRTATTTDTTGVTDPDATTTTVAPAPVPRVVPGEAVALIRIPKIGVDKAVVEGVGVSHLKRGPGHYPGTPMPGQPGNAAIAGHRTTYGAPFYDLAALEAGDRIEATTRQGEFTYEVEEVRVVDPTEVGVLAPTDDARLTLTTCHPRYSARQRLVVVSRLVDTPVEPPPVVDSAVPGGDATAGEEELVSEPLAFEDEEALSGDPAARGPTVLWGAAAALVWLLAWLVGRVWRRWPAYAIGTPVFLVVLFLFFENVARLFPANI